MKPEVSIVISSYNRLPFFRRTMFHIAKHFPANAQLVVVDDGSTEDILGEINKYRSSVYYKFIRFDAKEFEEKTGIKKFLNNPAVTNNIGFLHSDSEFIFLQGNEVIPWEGYSKLLEEGKGLETPYFTVFSRTLNVPPNVLNFIDEYSANLTQKMVDYSKQWPLQCKGLFALVTNYLSLTTKETWQKIGGYNELYYGGFGCEDTCYINSSHTLPGYKDYYSDVISLHQEHGGRTMYSKGNLDETSWSIGHLRNLEIQKSGQKHDWESGTIGVKEIITNF